MKTRTAAIIIAVHLNSALSLDIINQHLFTCTYKSFVVPVLVVTPEEFKFTACYKHLLCPLRDSLKNSYLYIISFVLEIFIL
jgi:hypothetical protein